MREKEGKELKVRKGQKNGIKIRNKSLSVEFRLPFSLVLNDKSHTSFTLLNLCEVPVRRCVYLKFLLYIQYGTQFDS
jgi:hypothetical protein